MSVVRELGLGGIAVSPDRMRDRHHAGLGGHSR